MANSFNGLEYPKNLNSFWTNENFLCKLQKDLGLSFPLDTELTFRSNGLNISISNGNLGCGQHEVELVIKDLTTKKTKTVSFRYHIPQNGNDTMKAKDKNPNQFSCSFFTWAEKSGFNYYDKLCNTDNYNDLIETLKRCFNSNESGIAKANDEIKKNGKIDIVVEEGKNIGMLGRTPDVIISKDIKELNILQEQKRDVETFIKYNKWKIGRYKNSSRDNKPYLSNINDILVYEQAVSILAFDRYIKNVTKNKFLNKQEKQNLVAKMGVDIILSKYRYGGNISRQFWYQATELDYNVKEKVMTKAENINNMFASMLDKNEDLEYFSNSIQPIVKESKNIFKKYVNQVPNKYKNDFNDIFKGYNKERCNSSKSATEQKSKLDYFKTKLDFAKLYNINGRSFSTNINNSMNRSYDN